MPAAHAKISHARSSGAADACMAKADCELPQTACMMQHLFRTLLHLRACCRQMDQGQPLLVKAELSCFKLKGEDYHVRQTDLSFSAKVAGTHLQAPCALLAVFDGHGGKKAAEYAAKQVRGICVCAQRACALLMLAALRLWLLSCGSHCPDVLQAAPACVCVIHKLSEQEDACAEHQTCSLTVCQQAQRRAGSSALQ